MDPQLSEKLHVQAARLTGKLFEEFPLTAMPALESVLFPIEKGFSRQSLSGGKVPTQLQVEQVVQELCDQSTEASLDEALAIVRGLKEVYQTSVPISALNITVPETPESSYPVYIGAGCAGEINRLVDFYQYSMVNVVVSKAAEQFCYNKLGLQGISNIHLIKTSGDQKKTPEWSLRLLSKFSSAGADRNSLIIIVGGGSTCDLAGYAASTYLRGVQFLYVPTTLLSQVDSCIGGKNGINFENRKNAVGTIAQPAGVIIDPELLVTLPPRVFRSGYGEMIKHGLISDRAFFDELFSLSAEKISSDMLPALIRRSCELKRKVVEQDPNEAGLRKTLNFGHTVGHAIESLSHLTRDPLLHGEAISIGMVAEGHIAHALGMISPDELQLIIGCLKKFQLPVKIPFEVSFEELHNSMKGDKKNNGEAILMALINSIGSCAYDIKVSEAQLRNGVDFVYRTSN